jgi:leucyl/phenylalanyl-tRNA--protein transferase
MIPWLTGRPAFPAPDRALDHPPGLLAAGGALDPEWLLEAYRQGIFPWFNDGEPILWWSPDPRLVLIPTEVRISRSLAKRLRRGEFEVRIDTAFAAVTAACAAPRRHAAGTWISPDIQAAYGRMHELGYAHSIECWQHGTLVGGLYGIALGRVFYGESMFARATDASKVALVHLARLLAAHHFALIDCQMSTAHLQSMGAREITRADFSAGLARWTAEQPVPGTWTRAALAGLKWD